MNKIAILIGAFENPQYLDALVQKMIHPRTNVYIHINKKNYQEFLWMFEKYAKHPSVHLYAEYAVNWGGHGMVESQLFLAKKALEDKENFYFHLITGSDILVRPISELIDFCEKNVNWNYLQLKDMRVPHWQLRYLCYNLYDIIDVRKNKLNFYFVKGLARLQYHLHLWRKKWPYKELKTGSGWWSLNRDALDFLYEKVMSKEIKKLWMYTHGPDEIIYQCILYNSSFKETLVGHNLCYLEWVGQPSPKTLTMDDWDKVYNSQLFFARKVHPLLSKEFIDKVFKQI